MGSLDDSNGKVSHGSCIENSSTKLSSLSELQQHQHQQQQQQQQNAPPPNPNPSRHQRLAGLLAFLPETGRHYVYNREAWIAAEEKRRQCSGSGSRSKKQQRRLERRQQLDMPIHTTDGNTAGAICTVSLRDCLLFQKENNPTSAAAATEMTTKATTAAVPAVHGSTSTERHCVASDPRVDDVICLALLDPQHQLWSRQVLSRLVPLCAVTDKPEPETLRSSMNDNDDKNVTSARIHGWVLLQSAAMSSQCVDYWFAHSGLTVLVCDENNDNVPKEPTTTDSADTVIPCAVDPATASAAATSTVAATTTCGANLLSPAPLSPWLWTALGMHHCPTVTILDSRTGRRCCTQQERLLLDANQSDAVIRKAWFQGPSSSNNAFSLSLPQISTCTVQ
jgi:hypothetical protein